jgi:hypothetical protein
MVIGRLIAISSAQYQGQAGENEVGLHYREADDDGLLRRGMKQVTGGELAAHPDDGQGAEIGKPVAPREGRRQFAGGEGPEHHRRDGDGEDELGQALFHAGGQIAAAGGEIAEADQSEDRQDDLRYVTHARLRRQKCGCRE